MKEKIAELDFKYFFNIIWKKRILVLISTVCLTFGGLFTALTTPYEYTSSTSMIPIKGGGTTGNNISQLASLAGFDLMGGLGSDQTISTNLYPSIVASTPFLKALSNFKIKIKGFEDEILLKDFLINYSELDFIDIYKKDLLGETIESLNKKSIQKSIISDKEYSVFSAEDKLIFELISDKIFISYAAREGILYIKATMPDPIAAAELTQKTADLLQEKIIEFKTKKAYDELRFLEGRYFEVKKEYDLRKNALADFQDKNVNLISSRSNILLNQLESDFNLTSNVFLQLSQQLESQKLKVKKETPVFSTIEPVSVPIIRSKPIRSNILKTSIVFGFILGIVLVLILHFFQNIKLLLNK
jgi:hypothetical protein